MITKPLVTLDQTFVQCEGNIVSAMGDEKVMLCIGNGKYYNLGEMGGQIWDMLESPLTVCQMVSSLTEIYEVYRDQCEDQVISFLESLLQEGLIQVKFENDQEI
ncbi:lasso peptide biosynthesis PqqD family chaperone [Falsibacillus albus]|uniref:Lasso peptide biosynthesis PqqD family chaperone n=1 Tax=Falsibacillus albus TaxID=2478915 RepID=A0A3L7K0J1_9BACI|nr:lasso peptide biosynthesis PqqD family chaperone [Falsibacillus albus]RLQ96290.1 lasso peptide biosynthesis PqqD family chaperone [Falsibacillus albus]